MNKRIVRDGHSASTRSWNDRTMDDTASAGLTAGPRRPNARGQGERLREEIISAAVQMLGDLADDEALSLRAGCTCGVDIPHLCLPVLSRS